MMASIPKPLESYHHVWLSVHPERSEEWLRNMLLDGFHVHHVDGDHSNDNHLNLVLIEGGDHMMLHNGKARLLYKPKKVATDEKPKVSRFAGRMPMKEVRRQIALKSNGINHG